MSSSRLPTIRRGPPLEILFEGRALAAFEGETVAAALLAAGVRTLRTTAKAEPRGVYCGIGLCFDCMMDIDGQPGVRACQTPVRAGMKVARLVAFGDWPAGA